MCHHPSKILISCFQLLFPPDVKSSPRALKLKKIKLKKIRLDHALISSSFRYFILGSVFYNLISTSQVDTLDTNHASQAQAHIRQRHHHRCRTIQVQCSRPYHHNKRYDFFFFILITAIDFDFSFQMKRKSDHRIIRNSEIHLLIVVIFALLISHLFVIIVYQVQISALSQMIDPLSSFLISVGLFVFFFTLLYAYLYFFS